MRHQELHFLNFLSALKPPLALVPRTETFWPHSACQLFCRSSNFTLRQLPGSGEAGPLAFLLCDNTQDVALCQKRGLERHCRRKGLSPCFCCGFSLSFFPAGGYPVAHTFPYCAQDRPQSSDHLTAVCPMQKPLTTDFQHFISISLYPGRVIFAQKLWTSSGWGKSIYIYIHFAIQWRATTLFQWNLNPNLWTRSFFLCLFLFCILSLIPKVFFRVLFIPL